MGKNLSKETHPSLASAGLKISVALTGKPGRSPTIKTRNKQSLSRIRYLETHHNHGLQWHSIIRNDGSVIKVQGTWEKKVAEWLNSMMIEWTRPCLTFMNHRRYTPDFFLPQYEFYIEVKGFWRDRDVHKLYLVLDEHPQCDIRYVDRTNIDTLTLELPKFIERFKRCDIDHSKFNNVWASDETEDS